VKNMTTTALATTVSSLADLRNVAQMLAASNYFDAKGNSEQAIAQIATKILAGQELGYGPFASVQGIHVIQGKPAMSGKPHGGCGQGKRHATTTVCGRWTKVCR
jgi:hypothetical protein